MANIFADNPIITIHRSKWKVPGGRVMTTQNTGELIPVKWLEVMPGETLSIDVNDVTREVTPIKPVMDLAAKDYFAFFVPFRLLMTHWKELWGENRTTHWTQPVKYSVPGITPPSTAWYEPVMVTSSTFKTNGTFADAESVDGYLYTESGGTYTKVTSGTYNASTTYYCKYAGWQKGTIADHLGLPTKVVHPKVSALPFRAYSLIYNEFFRDQNNIDATYELYDDTDRTGSNGNNPITDPVLGGKPLKVAKWHDLFTSCLPDSQKGTDVTIPLGTVAPVFTGSVHTKLTNTGLVFRDTSGNAISTTGMLAIDGNYSALGYTNSGSPNFLGQAQPANLYTDLTQASSASINDLRYAFQLQKLYESMARGGSRYVEQLRNLYGVISSDASLQRPQYLGGFQFQITQTEIPQTSSTDSVSPQGNLAAYSNSGIRDKHLFTHSFEEHGVVMIFTTIRTKHSYSQGVNKNWFHFDMEDFYNVKFANLGEQKVKQVELRATGTSTDDETFGFQEAWYEYRYDPDLITGEFRPNYSKNGGLSMFHYGDYFTSKPVLGADFINETEVNVDRTLTLSHDVTDQWYCDMKFNIVAVKPMPMHSIPGLIDHH